MKKIAVLLCLLLCLMLTGCNNSFAEEEYELTSMIASDDRYAETDLNFSVLSWNEYQISAKRFDGRETLLTMPVETGFDITVIVSFSRFSAGKAKLVLVDGNGNVSTIAECSAEDSAMLMETRISLTKGDNKFKLVGYGCKKLNVLMTLDYDTVVVKQ